MAKLKALKNLFIQSQRNDEEFSIVNQTGGKCEIEFDREVSSSYEMQGRLGQRIPASFSRIYIKFFGYLNSLPIIVENLREIIRNNDMEEGLQMWVMNLDELRKMSVEQWKNKLRFIRQNQYAENQNRVLNWLIIDAGPMCEIEPDALQRFFNDRWN
jgi:hypothetical protein